MYAVVYYRFLVTVTDDAPVVDFAAPGLLEPVSSLTSYFQTPEEMQLDMDRAFDRCSTNCYVAAAFYVLSLVLSLHQYWLNSKPEPTGYQGL